MTPDELRVLLDRLDHSTADELESQRLEFKAWHDADATPRERIKTLRESVVAFANQDGGTIVLGVRDRVRGRTQAIQGVETLDIERLRRDIHEGTQPNILIDILEVSEPEGRIVALNVPRGIPPHTTSSGVAKIRVGKESRPLTGPAIRSLIGDRVDRTAQTLASVGIDDLDPAQIARIRSILRESDRYPHLLESTDEALLTDLQLLNEDGVTLAALLLLGRTQALRKHAPQHEITLLRWRSDAEYDLRRDLREPILSAIDAFQEWLEPQQELTTVRQTGFEHREIPSISNLAAREALLNAVVHRDYFQSSAIFARLYPERLELTSPGGFIGGVTAANVLRHGPVHRNPLLAETMVTIGYVNRVGIGVDRIFDELLRAGKGPPAYRSDGTDVALSLPTQTNADFARLVVDEDRAGSPLSLDDLIVLRGTMTYESLDRRSAADLLQLPDQADAAERLVSLRRRGYLAPIGRGPHTAYRLSDRYAFLVPSLGPAWRQALLEQDRAREHVLAALQESGRLTNAEIREMTGFSRAKTLRLLGDLRDAGFAELRGQGRSAHYVPVENSPPS